MATIEWIAGYRAYLYVAWFTFHEASVVKIIIAETQRLCTTCRTRNPIEERGSDIRTCKGLSVNGENARRRGPLTKTNDFNTRNLHTLIHSYNYVYLRIYRVVQKTHDTKIEFREILWLEMLRMNQFIRKRSITKIFILYFSFLLNEI